MSDGKLPALDGKRVVRALVRAGFVVDRVVGSHHVMALPGDLARTVTVPVHSARDLKPGTLRSIIRPAGLSRTLRSCFRIRHAEPESTQACGPRLLLRHPRLAQALVYPLVRRDAGWTAALCGEIRLKCRDRLERPAGGQREVALERLARFGVMTGHGERRHKGRMNILDVIRIDRDRLARPINRLVIILQPEIGPRLAAVDMGERRIVRALPNRLVEIFLAFVEFPETRVVPAKVSGGVRVGRVQGERALVLGDGFREARLYQ